MEKVILVKNACPFCRGELRGNRKYKYLCRKCMLYFSEEEVNRFVAG
ncbi:MAG: hypothetical protein ACOCZ6_02535 [Nanoarchaeota archaeon]